MLATLVRNGTEDTDDSTSNEEQDPSDPKDNDDSTDKNNGAISDSTDEIATDKNQSAHPTGDDSKADDVIATPGDKGSADLTAGATSVKTEEVKQQTKCIYSVEYYNASICEYRF